MVFNILSCNRDDHVKNFSYLMNSSGEWALSPAYDITFSKGPGGEHSMTVDGEGRCQRRVNENHSTRINRKEHHIKIWPGL